MYMYIYIYIYIYIYKLNSKRDKVLHIRQVLIVIMKIKICSLIQVTSIQV